jgi:hypothetical protein
MCTTLISQKAKAPVKDDKDKAEEICKSAVGAAGAAGDGASTDGPMKP